MTVGALLEALDAQDTPRRTASLADRPHKGEASPETLLRAAVEEGQGALQAVLNGSVDGPRRMTR